MAKRRRPNPIPEQTAEQIKKQRRRTAPGEYKKNKGGRPSTYDPLYHPYEAERLCRTFGAGNAELARYFCLAESTISRWKEEHGEFRESCYKGWDSFAVDEAKQALLKRARGYDIELRSEKSRTVINPVTGVHEVLTELTITTKHLAPDVKAQEFILTNRDRSTFPNTQHNKFSGDPENPLNGGQEAVVIYLPDNGRDKGGESNGK